MSAGDTVLLRADRVVAGRGTFRTAPVSFELRAGGLLALVGRSGSGKTSVLRTLAGVAEPWSGSIEAIRPPGVCFQEPRLMPWRTVADNVTFGIGRRPDAEQRRMAAGHLRRLGIDDLAGRFPEDLSGGQRRRVAIARTLASGSRIVLVDEPFTQLDDDAAALVERALVDHVAAGGAVVIAVHSLDGARSMTDHAVDVAAQPS